VVVNNYNVFTYERWSKPTTVVINSNSIVEFPSIVATSNPFSSCTILAVKALLRLSNTRYNFEVAGIFAESSLLISKTYTGTHINGMSLVPKMFGDQENTAISPMFEGEYFVNSVVNDVTSKYTFISENSLVGGGLETTYLDGLQTGLKYYLALTDTYSSILISINSQLDTVEDYVWNPVHSQLGTLKTFTTSLDSQLDTVEDYIWNPLYSHLTSIKSFTTETYSMLDTNQSMIETNEDLLNAFTVTSDASMLNTLEDYHWIEVSMLDTVEDYVWNPVHSHLETLKTNDTKIKSMVDTVEDYVWNPLLSHLNTVVSMLDTSEQWAWDYAWSMLETQEDYHWDVQSFQQTSHSMLNTEEDYDHTIVSHLDTCQSFLMWHMVGLGTGMYYYDENGYYRNNEGTGTQILWATGETGPLTDESTGIPIATAEITIFRVTGSFATGIRDTGNRGIADQTKTDTAGKYHGYLDPGIYDFHAYKDGFIDEYKRRELTTV
jgi:hypothetical protein